MLLVTMPRQGISLRNWFVSGHSPRGAVSIAFIFCHPERAKREIPGVSSTLTTSSNAAEYAVNNKGRSSLIIGLKIPIESDLLMLLRSAHQFLRNICYQWLAETTNLMRFQDLHASGR